MTVDHFGERVAAHYDEDEADMFAASAVGPAVDLLAELAGTGRALEFAIGTGRLALPLSARGVPVAGIDLSAAMLERLRAKPGADRIDAVQGDFASTRVPGGFALVYLVFNTIGNVTSQDGQVAVFRNAARHLVPGGSFVIETGVPQLQRLPVGETVRPFALGADHVGFDEYDVVDQGLVSHHFTRRDGTWEHGSTPFRYVWPAELDLMARLAGMRLDRRVADWSGAEFTATSPGHVSIWTKDGDSAPLPG